MSLHRMSRVGSSTSVLAGGCPEVDCRIVSNRALCSGGDRGTGSEEDGDRAEEGKEESRSEGLARVFRLEAYSFFFFFHRPFISDGWETEKNLSEITICSRRCNNSSSTNNILHSNEKKNRWIKTLEIFDRSYSYKSVSYLVRV